MLRCKQESATTRYETRRLGEDDSYDDCGPRITRNMAARQVSCITITTSISNRWSHLRLTKRVPACVLLHI